MKNKFHATQFMTKCLAAVENNSGFSDKNKDNVPGNF